MIFAQGRAARHSHFNLAVGLGFVMFSCLCLDVTAQQPGIQDLCALDRLPVLKDSIKVGSVSSYDRSGGNDDGFSGKYSFVRKDPQGLVLAELEGPGVIYRVWTPTPSDDVIEFLFDGETRPRVEVGFRDLFLGRHPAFPPGLVGFGAGGYFCYVPMPFGKSCTVRLRGQKAQFYQINYALFPKNRQLRTFDPGTGADERRQAAELINSAGRDISSLVAGPGVKVRSIVTTATLRSNDTHVAFNSRKGGRIVGLKLWPAGAIAGKDRDLVLRISFDREGPAVLCPLSDFFGYAWGQPAAHSLLFGTLGATNYAYFPMPYDRSAKVEIVSERVTPVELSVEVLYADRPRSTNEGRFYGLWRRENPTKAGEPYLLLQSSGTGHLVGVSLQAQGFESGKTLFFEGDDQTTIDGELAVHGTGSEDFFNGGWYDVPDRWEKRISFPLSGCLAYAKHLGRTGAYRVFLGDAYSYKESLRQTIEHSGENNNIPTDYCSTVYFYSLRRPSCSLDLPALAQRKVIDLSEILFPAGWQLPIYAWSFNQASLTRKREKLGSDELRFLSLTAAGDDWFGPHFISPTVDVPVTAEYSIYIEAVTGPDQALVQLFRNENPIGAAVDLYSEKPALSGRLFLGRLWLAEGKNNLMLKLTGKNAQSSGLGLNLVTVICSRNP